MTAMDALGFRASDRRLVLRVMSRWRELAGARPSPRRAQLDPGRFGADWSSCFVIDVDPDLPRSRFAFVGHALRDPTWPTFDRQCLDECLEQTLLHAATATLDRVVSERTPIGEGVGRHVGAPVLFRSILLPLSESGGRIDGVLGAVNCREIA